jgi:cytochrome b
MLTHLVGWVIAACVLAMMLINGITMLTSPRMWFRLPSWVRANGRFKEEDCNNRAQSLSIRALGAIATVLAMVFLAVIFFG